MDCGGAAGGPCSLPPGLRGRWRRGSILAWRAIPAHRMAGDGVSSAALGRVARCSGARCAAGWIDARNSSLSGKG